MKLLPTIAAAAVFAALSVGNTALAHDPEGKVGPMVAALEPLKGAEFETRFLQMMIQHHRHGVEMAKLVNDHTKRTELREMAGKVTSAQQQEIDQMTKWLTDWYKASPVTDQKAEQEMKMHMSTLSEKRDADFDKAFLQMMPQHHHGAVEMSEQAEKKATHSELKELAKKMKKDQEDEIKQMKDWSTSWFGPL